MINKNTQNKKWERVLKTLDDAHISALKQLANITKAWELDSKELRANITIFKNEKWENITHEQKEDALKSLLSKIEEIKTK